ncbi:PPOX class F420-dependent oxidoreductase [Leifsonia sp. A12D58]|uniref:PPOX class F420-dependent oxidoreductase n=1 Tax=Leifsonia sp. A12D58 TaxID=3397674 RepID=UPI0039E1EAEE
MTATALEELSTEPYVLLTTFRKSGEPVSTPVWIVDSGDGRLLVTTAGNSGKVKRIRNGSRVELTPCDMRGATKDDAVVTPATAEVLTDSATRETIEAALLAKYGLRYRAIRAAGKLRGSDKVSVVLRLTLTPTA